MITVKGTVLGLCIGLAMTAAANHGLAADMRLVGSGASFPFPIYSAWLKAFSKETAGVTVDYQAKGSGAGVQDFINRTVDFAASDAAMTDDEIARVQGGAVLLPLTAGEIVLAYNLPSKPKELKLTRAAYTGIFDGSITQWSDPQLVASNPDAKLPDLPITVVVRSDSSGTNFVFTQHLSAIDERFKKEIGTGTTVQWPKTAKFVAAPKNDGVAATIKQTPGAIGYVEYSYAKLTRADTSSLENKGGKFVTPGEASGKAALAGAKLSGNDLRFWIPDPDGADAYPIATFTWMLFYKTQDPAKAAVLRKMVDYILNDGQKIADSMGYIPLPANIIEVVKASAVEIR
jgi:phosphate transport system substrate-binding protein